MKQRTIKIREETYKRLKALSKKEDRPMTAIIQASFDLYLKRKT